MEFINHANNHSFSKPAKHIAYLVIEGVNVLTTDAGWRRIRKRINKMGLTWYAPVAVDPVASIAIALLLDEIDAAFARNVDFFLEEMQIMGMLEEPEVEDFGGMDLEVDLPTIAGIEIELPKADAFISDAFVKIEFTRGMRELEQYLKEGN